MSSIQITSVHFRPLNGLVAFDGHVLPQLPDSLRYRRAQRETVVEAPGACAMHAFLPASSL